MIYSQSENSVTRLGQLWPIFCGFDGSLGFAVLWTGAGLVLWPRLSRAGPKGLVDSLAARKTLCLRPNEKEEAGGRWGRSGDALEMLSICGQAYLQATTVVHHGCPRV